MLSNNLQMPSDNLLAIVTIALFGLSAIGSIVWWLLNRNDAANARETAELRKSCNDLFKLHGEDANRLQQLELKVAGEYFKRDEFDEKFRELGTRLTDAFAVFTREFRELRDSVISHIASEARK